MRALPEDVTHTEHLDRRAFLARGALLLAAPTGVVLAAGCRSESVAPLSPIFQNWVITLHPDIEREVNEDFRSTAALAPVVAPPGGVDVGDFIQEAKLHASTWDTYIGMTPWVEMARLADKRVIQPWDAYIAADTLGDILPRIRAEATLDDHLYSWPFLIDVVVQGWNGELVERAGLDPTRPPASWDRYIDHARVVVDAGVAPYGCTFDPRGWRSLVPIAYSFGGDLVTEDGLFDFVHPATVEALEIMRRMVELSHPDVLDPEAVLASISPDEAMFAAQTVAYYVKYQNAHVRFASGWPDPTRLQLAPLPANGGPGGTVFWSTGVTLLRYGRNKRDAAAYANALTHDERIWRRSMGTGRDAAGQLPAFRSLPGWSRPTPTWVAGWVPAVTEAMRAAKPIRPHALGEEQFTVSRPYWEEYLRGSEPSAHRALTRAMAKVRESADRVSG